MVQNNFRQRYEDFGEDRVELFRQYGKDLLLEERIKEDIGKKLAISGSYLGVDGEPKSLSALARQFNTSIPVIRNCVKKTLAGMSWIKRANEHHKENKV